MAAIDSSSSCRPHPNSQPPPPIAHAPKPTRVICRSLAPSVAESSCVLGIVSLVALARPYADRLPPEPGGESWLRRCSRSPSTHTSHSCAARARKNRGRIVGHGQPGRGDSEQLAAVPAAAVQADRRSLSVGHELPYLVAKVGKCSVNLV